MSVTPSIEELLRHMASRNASDLHLKAGAPPGLRLAGLLTPLSMYDELTPADCEALAAELTGHPVERLRHSHEDMDFSVDSKHGRLRVSLFSTQGILGLVLRRIPHEVPTLEELGLPSICQELARKKRGLVLVTGPTGSGKSTTLAAMIDHINSNIEGHILTLEDPIEFIHQTRKCYITQREIGSDVGGFAEALRRSFRQDPDIILVGELRDLETIEMTMTAAETGHLVLATLHTPGASQAIDRIIDAFPHEAQSQVRLQLAMSLQGVISQALVPKIGGGLAAANEIMTGTDAVRACIREGKTHQLNNLIQTGNSFGMQTMESDLCRLSKNRVIAREHALSYALNKKELTAMLSEAGSSQDELVRPEPSNRPAKKPNRNPLINQFK